LGALKIRGRIAGGGKAENQDGHTKKNCIVKTKAKTAPEKGWVAGDLVMKGNFLKKKKKKTIAVNSQWLFIPTEDPIIS